MKIAIIQMNAMVGDMRGNAAKIIEHAQAAIEQGADLIVTPELSLCGYPPEDLLYRDDFYEANQRALADIAEAVPNIALLVGHPQRKDGALYNAASLIQAGKVTATYFKQALPNYSVFDEKRYFETGDSPLVFSLNNTKIGVLLCEDCWVKGPAEQSQAAGAEILVSMNASPYRMEKLTTRHDVFAERVAETGLTIIHTNLVGGQDELVFDGASFVMDNKGTITQQLPAFVEAFGMVELDEKLLPSSKPLPPKLSVEAMVYNALKLGVADYINKNGFPSVVLGLSGGIDSALTLAVAVDALGADRVKAVMMSSKFTADMSVEDAIEMAELVGVEYSQLPIKNLYELFNETLAPEFGDLPFDTTEENLQARIRGMLLMALSNKFGSIVLTTGNKSEMAVGYSTLYGDMAGGFAVLKDVPKTLVYALAKYRNRISPTIPERIITRPPSAELREDQKDEDSLPPYDVLDAIMQAYVEEDMSRDAIMQLGYEKADVERVTKLIDRNEYKRRQSPVGVRITQKGFGKDRRYPITCKLTFE